MIRYKNIFILIFILILVTLFGSNQLNAYTVKGAFSCAKVLSYQKDAEFEFGLIRWMQGYVTGRNFRDDVNMMEFDHEIFFFALIKYCRDNPLADVDDAAISVYSDLKMKYQD